MMKILRNSSVPLTTVNVCFVVLVFLFSSVTSGEMIGIRDVVENITSGADNLSQDYEHISNTTYSEYSSTDPTVLEDCENDICDTYTNAEKVYDGEENAQLSFDESMNVSENYSSEKQFTEIILSDTMNDSKFTNESSVVRITETYSQVLPTATTNFKTSTGLFENVAEPKVSHKKRVRKNNTYISASNESTAPAKQYYLFQSYTKQPSKWENDTVTNFQSEMPDIRENIFDTSSDKNIAADDPSVYRMLSSSQYTIDKLETNIDRAFENETDVLPVYSFSSNDIILTGNITTEYPTYTTYLYSSASAQDDMVANVKKDDGLTNATYSVIVPSNISENALSDEILWPVKHAAEIPGDILLGGLMMVHEREDSKTCGPIMPQGGIQALETMLYTIDKINGDLDLLPNVTLGALILDDCDKDTYGLEMAVDFIKGSISNIDGAEYHCNKTQVRKVISGVVGAASSVTSIQVANLLRLFKIPQVSFFSTSPELSNKQRFEYFTRTIPSDHYQVKAMVEIVKKMNWSYVSIIYEESNYGVKAFEELETLLANNQICIAVKEKLVKDSGVAKDTAYDNIVLKLLTKPRARGVIIFGSDQEVAAVMRAVRRNNATGSFSWIGSDGWSARTLVSDGNEAEVEGTLSVQPQANPVVGFEQYFLNLTVENNKRNPWFVEFWEDHFQCKYPNSSRTPYNKKYTRSCTTQEKLENNKPAFEGQLQFVSDAVLAFAYAFRNMHENVCGGRSGLCEAMKPVKGTELLKYLRNVTFQGLTKDDFRFDANGDGPARYNILHFKQISRGKYHWINVGKYMEGELELNMSDIQFKIGHPRLPESVCSLPCERGQAKKYVEGESCCWHCFNCTQYQIVDPQDERQCFLCHLGTLPNFERTECQNISEVYLRAESDWAIGSMALAATGIFMTLFVWGVFIRYSDTPVVRASGQESCYLLLLGILLCYCVTFLLVMRPTDHVCRAQKFCSGFCFSLVYAAVLTKTIRISRIFNSGKHSAKRPGMISPMSQIIIIITMASVEFVILGISEIVSPVRAIHHYPSPEDNHLVCSSHIDASYMIAFAYPIVLIVICTVYAVLTRKIPEAFNESKYIGFAMYATCVIWLAFVPIYFATSGQVPIRITSMSVTISLSAKVTLACLFTPKLYIILIHPERNVRQSVMPPRYGATRSPAVTGTTHTGSMMAAVVCVQHSTHSNGDLELREDIIHQQPRTDYVCMVVHRKTQTEETSNTNCAPPHTPAAKEIEKTQKIDDLPSLNCKKNHSDVKRCHIANNSSNGPVLLTSQQKPMKDVRL